MTDIGLADHYRAYLTVLNERRFDELIHFVHDELRYNERPITRAEYADMIASDAAAIPDLHFDVKMLVVQGNDVACRLRFDCTPQGEFLGFHGDGRRIVFGEHVFYRFRDGRIAHVWSLIDRDAIEHQLTDRQRS